MIMRRLLALALAMLLLCGAALSEGGFSPALDTSTECEIHIVGSYKNFESLEAEFDRFNAYYPGVSLNYTSLDDYNHMLAVALSSPEAPNIFCASSWMVDNPNYAYVFDAAEDLSAMDIDLSVIRDSLLYTDPNGAVPMVPVFSTTYGMLVNEAIFEKEGLAIPTTYAELLSTCEALIAAGYSSPMIGYNNGNDMFGTLIIPMLNAAVRGDAEAVEKLNAVDPSAAEIVRPILERVADLMAHDAIDLEVCNALEDNYTALILRFFEGDVPMIIATGDTVSGTKKRESMSEAFTASPFTYSFHPIPITDEGTLFVSSANLQFSVNKNCDNLDMTNEFMRFLITVDELNEMARVKRLLTPTKELSFDDVYAAFGDVPADRCITQWEVGLLDEPCKQVRNAAYYVANGSMTVDEATAAFGSLGE